jgi:hypothetical protein
LPIAAMAGGNSTCNHCSLPAMNRAGAVTHTNTSWGRLHQSINITRSTRTSLKAISMHAATTLHGQHDGTDALHMPGCSWLQRTTITAAQSVNDIDIHPRGTKL